MGLIFRANSALGVIKEELLWWSSCKAL